MAVKVTRRPTNTPPKLEVLVGIKKCIFLKVIETEKRGAKSISFYFASEIRLSILFVLSFTFVLKCTLNFQ